MDVIYFLLMILISAGFRWCFFLNKPKAKLVFYRMRGFTKCYSLEENVFRLVTCDNVNKKCTSVNLT